MEAVKSSDGGGGGVKDNMICSSVGSINTNRKASLLLKVCLHTYPESLIVLHY